MQPMREKFKIQNKAAWAPLVGLLELRIQQIRITNEGTLHLGVLAEPSVDSRSISLSLRDNRWRLCIGLNGHSYLEERPDSLGLGILGWVKGDLEDLGPIRLFPKATSDTKLGWAIISALQITRSIEPSSWLTFGDDDWAESVMGSSALWHHSLNRRILCLPGQNVGLTEESDF